MTIHTVLNHLKYSTARHPKCPTDVQWRAIVRQVYAELQWRTFGFTGGKKRLHPRLSVVEDDRQPMV